MSASNPQAGVVTGNALRPAPWRPLQAIGKKCLSLLRRERAAGAEPAVDVENTLELRREYRELVLNYCVRHGVDPKAMRVRALSLGYRQGKEVYVVLVTVTDPGFEVALQLAHLAPNIEKRVAEMVGSTWLGDYTHFSGVWLHWSEQIRIPEAVRMALHVAHQGEREASVAGEVG